jgi:hypothetical protein
MFGMQREAADIMRGLPATAERPSSSIVNTESIIRSVVHFLPRLS